MRKLYENVRVGDKFKCIRQKSETYGAVFEVMLAMPPDGSNKCVYEVKITYPDGGWFISGCNGFAEIAYERI